MTEQKSTPNAQVLADARSLVGFLSEALDGAATVQQFSANLQRQTHHPLHHFDLLAIATNLENAAAEIGDAICDAVDWEVGDES